MYFFVSKKQILRQKRASKACISEHTYICKVIQMEFRGTESNNFSARRKQILLLIHRHNHGQSLHFWRIFLDFLTLTATRRVQSKNF